MFIELETKSFTDVMAEIEKDIELTTELLIAFRHNPQTNVFLNKIGSKLKKYYKRKKTELKEQEKLWKEIENLRKER